MDIELGCIYKIITEEKMAEIIDNNITTNFFYGRGKPVFEFMMEYYRQYRKSPSLQVLEREFKGIKLDKIEEPVQYFIDELRERHKYNTILQGIEDISDELQDLKVDEAETLVYRLGSKLVTEIKQSRDLNYTDDIEDRIRRYKEKKKYGGLIGIPTLIDPLNDITGGAQKGQLMTISAPPKTGKCVSEHSKVGLPDGRVVTMREFVENEEDSILSLDEDTGKIVESKVNKWIDSGKKEGYKVKTKQGREVTVTSCHPFLTPFGWKSMDDGLEVEDQIAIPTKYPENYSFGNLGMDKEEVEMIALFIAEGGLTAKDLRFSNQDPEILEMADEIAEYYGLELKHIKNSDYGINGGQGNTKNLIIRKLKELGLKGKLSKDRFIPDDIFKLKKPLLKRFIEVLFNCDGSMCGYYYEYCSASEQLVKDLRHLLIRFGINPYFRFKENDGEGAYILEIRGKEAIKFENKFDLIDRKNELTAENVGTKTSHGYNIQLTDELINKIRKKAKGRGGEIGRLLGLNKGWEYSKKRLSSRGINPKRAKIIGEFVGIPELKNMYKEDLFYDKVVEIEPVGKIQMYDLEIEDTHNFIVNNVLVHNSWWEVVVIVKPALKWDYRVLFITKEMEPEEIALRLDSSLLGFEHKKLRKGTLGNSKEKEYFEALEEVKKQYEDLLVISGDDGGSGVTAIQGKIEEHNPDLVVIDGSYLIKDEEGGRNHYERTTNITRALKRLARVSEVPVYNSTQMGRQVGRNKPGTLEDLSFSYAYAQDSDLVISLYRSKELEQAKKIGCKIAGIRDGENGHFVLNWDFLDMELFGTLAEMVAANEEEEEEVIIY